MQLFPGDGRKDNPWMNILGVVIGLAVILGLLWLGREILRELHMIDW